MMVLKRMDIPIYYDPMIAKLMVHGKDRTEAIEKMLRAIQDYQITGVETTLPFCAFVLKHEAFVSGKFDTGFIPKYFKPEMLNHTGNENDEALAIVASHIFNNHKQQASPVVNGTVKKSKWRENRLKT
jgi:acetyl-CoA carboxylase biotin carboxylase subunit